MPDRSAMRWLLCAALILFCAHGAAADGRPPLKRGTREDMVALVAKAVAYFKASGSDKAIAAFNDPRGQFVDRDLWIFAYDSGFTSLASGYNPKFVGRNRLDEQDADGKYINREKMDLMKGQRSFWQDVKFADPLTHKILPKHIYCESTPDAVLKTVLICSGYYDAQS